MSFLTGIYNAAAELLQKLANPSAQSPRFRNILALVLMLVIFGAGLVLWQVSNGAKTFEVEPAGVIVAGLMLVSVLSSKISSGMNMPCLLLFLGVGLLAGSPGFGNIQLGNRQIQYANYIGSFAMACILFSGGFNTSLSSVKKVLGPGLMLSFFGVLLTAAFTGLCFLGVAELLNFSDFKSWELCLLLGAIVASTDAAAVFAILRSRGVSLRGDLKPLLEFESGSNDPMAAILTGLMTAICFPEPGAAPIVWWMTPLDIILQLGVGVVIGVLLGWFAAWLYNWIDLEYDGLYYVLSILIVLAAFYLPPLLKGNGFMGVYAAGLAMGNRRFVLRNSLGKFNDGVSWLMQVLLFTMLGLLVQWKLLREAVWPGVAAVLLLMLVARPLATFICLCRSRFTTAERTLISWVGLRGGAPIMLATVPLASVVNHETQLLFHVVFFIVVASVLLQGTTLMPLAKLLRLDAPVKKTPRAPVSVEETGDDNMISREFTAGKGVGGVTLAELKMPAGALVLMICRDDKILLPRGTTALQYGDVVTVLGTETALAECRRLLARN